MVLLDAGDFRTTQPTGTANLDAIGTEILGRLQNFLHRTPERNATLQLQGNVFRDELGINLGRLDLHNIHVHFLPRHFAQVLLELINF